jgi:uncharacterized protein YgiM (DUF1202 family)
MRTRIREALFSVPHFLEKDQAMSKIVTATAAIGFLILAGAAQAAVPQSTSPATQPAVMQVATDAQMIVSHSYAHLRKSPDTKSAILLTLKKGTKVDVIEKVAAGKWAHVKVGKAEGYVAVSLLK